MTSENHIPIRVLMCQSMYKTPTIYWIRYASKYGQKLQRVAVLSLESNYSSKPVLLLLMHYSPADKMLLKGQKCFKESMHNYLNIRSNFVVIRIQEALNRFLYRSPNPKFVHFTVRWQRWKQIQLQRPVCLCLCEPSPSIGHSLN